MNRQALSPLTATIVLIVFAISLGAFILNIGGGLDTTAPVMGACRQFSILQIDARTTTPQVCFGEIMRMTEPVQQQNVNELSINYDTENKYLIRIR